MYIWINNLSNGVKTCVGILFFLSKFHEDFGILKCATICIFVEISGKYYQFSMNSHENSRGTDTILSEIDRERESEKK